MKFSGFGDLRNKLPGGEELEKKLEQALLKGAIKVERDAVLKAPVDTGELRNSIGYKKGEFTDEQKEYIVYARSKHAKFIEYGTRKSKAQPFLRPAFQKNKQSIIDEINKAMQEALKGD